MDCVLELEARPDEPGCAAAFAAYLECRSTAPCAEIMAFSACEEEDLAWDIACGVELCSYGFFVERDGTCEGLVMCPRATYSMTCAVDGSCTCVVDGAPVGSCRLSGICRNPPEEPIAAVEECCGFDL